MPPSAWKPATRSAIHAAAMAVAETLNPRPYAVVGGAACMLLGSMRLTEDVDLVMPRGTVAEYRKLFRTPEAESRGFTTGTEQPRHTFHGAERALVEFLSPAGMFRGAFDENTPTVVVDRVRVLHPLNLLDAKCESVFTRGEHKKHTDAEDIRFLLAYCADNGLEITFQNVPHAHPEAVEHLMSEGWVPREAWEKAGYVPGEGWQAAKTS
ncbi:hypothetical protein GSI_06885 [Ganoderma sinense ZZ0214-1]|uniref:Uncharacterized protein n=1 Tax=Ganoderma sinense ZZ0214-1 TaxID=1077348 RepID=A0A2G8SAD0_9APHY|nr:hypothetical protein GSI_06885 [Ganoderma sinense ZZ0214-1]